MNEIRSGKFGKNFMLVLFVAVLLLTSIAVSAVSNEKEDHGVNDFKNDESLMSENSQYVDNISIEARTSIEDGVNDTASGEIDALLESVSSENISAEQKENIDTWDDHESYTNLLLNPVYDKAEGVPVVEVDGVWRFNPFGDSEIRYALNNLINRTLILEEMYGGHGKERYFALDQNDPGYDEYFEQVVEQLGVNEHDPQLATEIIQQRMGFWAENNTIEAMTGMSVNNQGTEENPEWYLGSNPIDLECIIRIEDTRTEVGHYVADLLEEQGFVTNRYEQEASTAFYNSLYSDPKDLEYHFYTGGWLQNSAYKHEEATLSQMYASWYGWMPGLQLSGWWQYEAPEELEEKSQDLYYGRVPDYDTYWNYMKDIAELGIDESVRLFLTSETQYYPHSSDQVEGATTDVVTGWSDIYSPRTLKTADGNFTGAVSSTSNSLFMDNWNHIGGSGDYNGQRLQSMTRDEATVINPETGVPNDLRADYDVDINYQYDENDDLIGGIEVPQNAVQYDVGIEEWYEVGDMYDVASKVTYNWSDKLGTWHSGYNISIKEMAGYYAWARQLIHSQEDGGLEADGKFHGPYSTSMMPLYEDIKALEFDEENKTVTIYGNYTHPSEDLTAHYYMDDWFNEVPLLLLEGMTHLYGETAYYDTVGEDRIWSWSTGEEVWIDWLNQSQGDILTDVLQLMAADGWIPYGLREEANPPVEPMTEVEVAEEITSHINFFNEFNHYWISNGPYRITLYDENTPLMEMERWTQDDGYPFPPDYLQPEDQVSVFNETPTDGTTDIPIDTTLSADIESDNHPTEVEFYLDGNMTYSESINENQIVETDSLDLDYGTLYEWEIIATTDGGQTVSSTYSFTTVESYTLNMSAGEGGTTDPQPGNHTYEQDTSVQVDAISDEGWIFSHWTGDYPDGQSEEESISVVMDGNKTLSAHFEEASEYSLTIDVNGNGSTDPEEGIHHYYEDDIVQVDAIPNEGWQFTHWTGDVPDGREEESVINITMDRDKSINAHFEIKIYELTTNIEGNGSVNINPDLDEYEHDARVQLEALPEEGWIFSHWTGDVPDGREEESEISITMDSDKELTAHFEITTYGLTVEVNGEGTVNINQDSDEYDYGTVVELEAIAEEDWTFSNWSGDIDEDTSEDTFITIEMDEEKTLIANFEEEDPELETLTAQDVTYESAELRGELLHLGRYEEVEIFFRYRIQGEEDWLETASQTLSTTDIFSFGVELESDTAYEFKAVLSVGDEEYSDDLETFTTELRPAEFELSNLRVEPEQVEAGEEVELKVDVTNIGDIEEEYTVEFYMGGELVGSDTVSVPGGETVTASVTCTEESAGEFEVEVESLSSEVNVREDESFLSSFWWIFLIIALIAAVIAVLLIKGKEETLEQDEFDGQQSLESEQSFSETREEPPVDIDQGTLEDETDF